MGDMGEFLKSCSSSSMVFYTENFFMCSCLDVSDTRQQNWTIKKMVLPGKSPSLPKYDNVSRTISRSIISMTIYDQRLLMVFFEEGDYSCFDMDTLKDFNPNLHSASPEIDQPPSTLLESTGIGQDQRSPPMDYPSSIASTDSPRSIQSDITKIPTSEFLKMLRAQSQTSITSTSISPASSETRSDDETPHQVWPSLTRKRKSPVDDETQEQPSPRSIDDHPRSTELGALDNHVQTTSTSPVISVSNQSSRRAKAIISSEEPAVYYRFPAESLLSCSFTCGFYGCVSLSKMGTLSYLYLGPRGHGLAESSLSNLLQSFIWKWCMHADGSDVLMNFLKYHENIEDKPTFYRDFVKTLASVCARKNISTNPNALNTFIVLLR
jgi:hypothetical protein